MNLSLSIFAKKWSNSDKLRLIFLAIFAGIFFGQTEFWSEYFLFVGGILLFSAITLRNFWIGLLAAFCLANFYGQFRNIVDFKGDELVNHHNQEMIISGTVTSFPDYREKSTRVTFQAEKMKSSEEKNFEKTSGNLLLVVPPEINLHYGDKITFQGKLTAPRNFGDFDYQKFLRRFDIQTIVKNPKKIEFKEELGGNFLLRMAESSRNFFAENLKNALPPPHSTIAMGILLGVKTELPHFTKNDFKRSGLQHLLVVSGFNVSVVILLVTLCLKNLGRRVVFLGVLLAVTFFVAMTGAEAPVIRAAIMGSVVGLSAASGRFSDGINAFFLALVLMGLFDPKIVQTDIGFFLSAAATWGILIFVPWLEKFGQRIPNFLEIRTVFFVTLAAQIAVLPILGIYFQELPVTGIFSNLLAEPLVPLGMGGAFLLALLGWLPLVIVKILAIPTFVILELLLWVAHIFGIFAPLFFDKNLAFGLMLIIFSILLVSSFMKKSKKCL